MERRAACRRAGNADDLSGKGRKAVRRDCGWSHGRLGTTLGDYVIAFAVTVCGRLSISNCPSASLFKLPDLAGSDETITPTSEQR